MSSMPPDILGSVLANQLAKSATEYANSPPNVTPLVRSIRKAQHIYTIGAGKSGIVAKYAASLWSTLSRPTSYLLPSDIMHGELAQLVYGKDQLIVVFSKDGHSKEVNEAINAIPKEVEVYVVGCNFPAGLTRSFWEVVVPCGDCYLTSLPYLFTEVLVLFCYHVGLLLRPAGYNLQDIHPAGAIGDGLVAQGGDKTPPDSLQPLE